MDTEESKLYVGILFGMSVLMILIAVYLVSILRSHYMLKKYERYNLQAWINVRDTERKRIAADLHDALGSSLVAVKFHLANLKSLIPAHSIAIQKLIDTISESITTMRSVSLNMIPELLIQSGLGTALKSLIYQDKLLSNMKINFEYDLPGLSPEKSIHVYYIIREIINNIGKHSEASLVDISITFNNQKIEMRISDNGVGFDKEILSQKPKGLGMHNIFTRTSILSGTINMETQIGRGVNFMIDFPEDLIMEKSITEKIVSV